MHSLSADPTKFYWMRYASERATSVPVKGQVLKVVKGDLFGVREVRGKEEDEYILADGTKFRLPINKSEILMNRSKEFKGTPPLAKVANKARPSSPVKPKVKKIISMGPKVVVSKPLKAKVTKLVPHKDSKGGPVSLRHVELPLEDDFTDHDVPHEFRKYARVESAEGAYYFTAMASCLSISTVEVMPGVAHEFHQIIQEHLEPNLKSAKKLISEAIKKTSGRVRAWAMEHMQMAQKLHKRTDLFEKLINDPMAATTQLAHKILGIEVPGDDDAEVDKAVKKLDDMLDSITL